MKIEGVALMPGADTKVLLVAEADDRGKPAALFECSVGGAAERATILTLYRCPSAGHQELLIAP